MLVLGQAQVRVALTAAAVAVAAEVAVKVVVVVAAVGLAVAAAQEQQRSQSSQRHQESMQAVTTVTCAPSSQQTKPHHRRGMEALGLDQGRRIFDSFQGLFEWCPGAKLSDVLWE